MQGIKEKFAGGKSKLKTTLGISNEMALPRLVKVVLSSGTGKVSDKKKKELIFDRITRIAGQKASVRPAKKSIANFKLREGQPIGVVVTLRGERMTEFLNKLIHVVMPRMRDFKGITPTSIDDIGNMTIGITEHTVFPETAEDDLKDVFGLAVTIVTTARNKNDAEALFRHLGLPIK